MAHQGGHNSAEEHQHHVRGLFGKMKDSMDFTKHLGFQSGPDSLANQEALARARDLEARRAEEQQQQNSSPGAGIGPTDGIGGMAETLSGAVAPRTQSTFLQTSEDAPPTSEQNKQRERSPAEPVQFDKSPPHSSSPAEQKVEQGKEKSKASEGGLGGWMAHKLHQVSRAAASKDLSDELLKNEAKAKNAK